MWGVEDGEMPKTVREYLKPVLEDLEKQIGKTNPSWEQPTYGDGLTGNRVLERLCGLAAE